jgi:alkylhydroperoxidase family enzyme
MSQRYQGLVRALEAAVLEGPGRLPPGVRRTIAEGAPPPEALAAYIETVRTQAYRVTGEDVAALVRAGCDEDEIFEATVSAALGAGLLRLRAGLRALEGKG